jgi:glycosyltransferase involved in cell wall biosynthesis
MEIVMAVLSDLTTDARVQREALALGLAGHAVHVVGFTYSGERPPTADGVHYHLWAFPARGSLRLVRLLGAAMFVARAGIWILRSRADAYHVHNLHLAIPCLVAARRAGAHVVYDAHELVREMASRRARAVVTVLERVVWHRADAVVTTNQHRSRYLRCLHGGREPVVLANYPMADGCLAPVNLRSLLRIPVSARLLLYQGGFYTRARCFDAVAQALCQFPEWHWVLIGFGSPAALTEIEQLLQRAGISDRSHVLPPVPAQELASYTASADVGVVPLSFTELNNYLGDTNKLFEYLHAGLPVIGSDFPVMRGVLCEEPEGPLGAVFDPDNPTSIARSLRWVEENFDNLATRASEVGPTRYSWEVEQRKLTSLYDSFDKTVLDAAGGKGFE